MKWCGHTSTGDSQPVQVESEIYEIITNTSICRFRVLSQAECMQAQEVLMQVYHKHATDFLLAMESLVFDRDIPVS